MPIQERRAVLLICVAVLFYSFFPVFNALSVETLPPFLYVAKACLWACFFEFAFATFPRARRRRFLIGVRAILGPKRREVLMYLTLAAILASIAYFLLVTSFKYASNTAVSILYELWPIFLVFLLPRALAQFAAVGRLDLFALLLAGLGLVFILIPVGGSASALFAPGLFDQGAGGLLMALLAAALMAVATLFKTIGLFKMRTRRRDLPIFLSIEFVNRLIAGLFCLAMHALFEGWDTRQVFALDPSLGFGFIEAFGGLFYWMAITQSRRSIIHLLLYVAPILAFVWLFALGMAQLAATILFGAMMILAANTLAHFRADRSLAFSATVTATILSAVACYYLGSSERQTFFTLLSIPVSLFGILVAFMMSRLSIRDREQEAHAVDILEELSTSDDAALRKDVFDLLCDSFEQRSWRRTSLRATALEARLAEANATAARKSLRRFWLGQSNPFLAGEIIILWTVGFTSILAAHFYRPPQFFGDFIPVVLTASVVYLCLTIFEQKNFSVRRDLATIFAGQVNTKEISTRGYREMIDGAILLQFIVYGLFAVALLEKYGLIGF